VPVTARSLVLALALAVFGLGCTSHREDAEDTPVRVAVDAGPMVPVPRERATIEVLVPWPDRSALEIERDIVRVLERALGDVPGVTRIHGSAQQGRAAIVLTLDAGADPDRSKVAVRDRLDSARASLPVDVSPVLRADLAPPASAQVFVLSTTTGTGMDLHRVAQRVREAVYTVPGVGEIDLCGGREARLVIALDPARLVAYRLSLGAIVAAVRPNLGDGPGMPAGLIAVAAIRTMDELTDVIVGPGAAPVALRDVASVSVGSKVPECDAARTSGGLLVLGSVRARRGADLEAVDAAVRARLAAYRAELPPGFVLEMPAAPLWLALDLLATPDPAETAAHASGVIGAALATAGPVLAGRPAFVQAPTTAQSGVRVDGALVLDVTGLGAAERVTLERALAGLPGVHVRGPGVVTTAGELDDPSVLRFRITGAELDTDRRLAREAAEIAATVPGVLHAAARDDHHPTVVLEPRRARMAMLGLTPDELFVVIAAALEGVPVGSLQTDGARMSVVVQLGALEGDLAARMAALGALGIGLSGGGTVPLSEIVDIRLEPGPGMITRIDGRRAVTVEVRVVDPSPERRVALQQALAASLRLPPGHTVIQDD
jgi:multidrug efflux pump subunit AcrB